MPKQVRGLSIYRSTIGRLPQFRLLSAPLTDDQAALLGFGDIPKNGVRFTYASAPVPCLEQGAANCLMMVGTTRHRLKATERGRAVVAPVSAAVPSPSLVCARALSAG